MALQAQLECPKRTPTTYTKALSVISGLPCAVFTQREVRPDWSVRTSWSKQAHTPTECKERFWSHTEHAYAKRLTHRATLWRRSLPSPTLPIQDDHSFSFSVMQRIEETRAASLWTRDYRRATRFASGVTHRNRNLHLHRPKKRRDCETTFHA